MGGIFYTSEDFKNVFKALSDGTVLAEAMNTSVVAIEKWLLGAHQ
jgi:hypothetical protein